MMRLSHLALLVWAGLLTSAAGSTTPDRDRPIEIAADLAVQEGDTITYSGDVVIVQGDLRIEGDRVVVTGQERRVEQVVATGEPARFWQRPEPDAAEIHGHALSITYRHVDNHIFLEREAHVEQDGSTLSGDRIDYFPDRDTIRAQRGTNGNGRVHMILQPDREARE